jgi:hypothetical protein
MQASEDYLPSEDPLEMEFIGLMGESITNLFRPFTLPREARMQGRVELCLYLVTITILIRFLLRR